MVLEPTEFIYSFVVQIINIIDVIPRIVIMQNVVVKRHALLAELYSRVAANKTVILVVLN